MSIIDTQLLVLVDQASPSSLSSQATEHSYVGSVRREDSPVNLAPNWRLTSQHGEERDCSPVPHPRPNHAGRKNEFFFSEPASSKLNGHLVLVNETDKILNYEITNSTQQGALPSTQLFLGRSPFNNLPNQLAF